ncbi:MAG: hypothetical protein C6W58_10905 [Bacillaceae bacterium]|jgi:hypothetical protein|uniref:Uncharacterized protein n=1 Tax=Aeribacillus pallidus TaxID=33936 RepID=A0A165YGM8_9BACI|nr:hypothetical protein [Aeribacillus pallidus]AXI38466.1 hypothetical protein CX649_01660 [Bacillaceae bacterium ZC4]REJ15756.1 MAG: hypothetical protein C6W58_10905 [Bacillaceae bacterium]TVZ86149.1 hypothetical protein FB379_105139 [Aeribacillus composti]ASS89382.1 hypothetical protein AP3564_03125 [Aeribacillus pallidus]KZM55434.1 hypothetical protein A3Q35_12070 [Aeribacillus pallidus]
MAGVIFLFFIISMLFLVGAFYNLKLANSASSYPPKHLLKKRASVLAIGGLTSLLIAFLLYYIQ